MIGGLIIIGLLVWWGFRVLRWSRAEDAMPESTKPVYDMLVLRHGTDLRIMEAALFPDEGRGHFTARLRNGTTIEYDRDGHELRRTSLNGEHL